MPAFFWSLRQIPLYIGKIYAHDWTTEKGYEAVGLFAII